MREILLHETDIIGKNPQGSLSTVDGFRMTFQI